MTWHKYRKYNRGSGWDRLGPAIAMMAASGGKWNFEFDHFDHDGGGGGMRAKRRGRMFGSGELRLALLALIGEEPRHGYELIKAIEELTGGHYAPSPGAVYPTLQLLADEGKIEEAEAEGAKKPFKLTPEGADELATRADEVAALMDRLTEHGERAEKVRSPDLFRAMGNLASVLRNRARAGRLDQDTMDQIVDMIDEMAKRIERL